MTTCLLSLLLTFPIAADTLYVSKDGVFFDPTGGVHVAYLDIQPAIDASTSGDVILVQPGSYPWLSASNLQFYGKAITLRADQGNETTFIEPLWGNPAMLLQAGDTTNLLIQGFTFVGGQPAPANPTNFLVTNSRGIVALPGSGATFEACRFFNFFSEQGVLSVIGSPGSSLYLASSDIAGSGGAMHLVGAEIVLSNCVFAGNGAGYDGGAIYATSNTMLTITDTIFSNNTANIADSIEIRTYGQQTATYYSVAMKASVTNSYGGGALYLGASVATISNCIFIGNHAGHGGAVDTAASSTATVYTSTFLTNSAWGTLDNSLGGGAIAIDDSAMSVQSCLFSNNHAGILHDQVVTRIGREGDPYFKRIDRYYAGGAGGAVCMRQGKLAVGNCHFMNHQAPVGGAIASFLSSMLILSNNSSFTDNQASSTLIDTQYLWSVTNAGGGAIYMESGTLVAEDTRFDGNQAGRVEERTVQTIGEGDDPFYQVTRTDRYVGCGGALDLRGVQTELRRVQVAGNEAPSGGGIYAGPLVRTTESNTVSLVILADGTVLEGNIAYGFNSTNNGPRGGGLLIEGGDLVVSNTTVIENFAGWTNQHEVLTIGEEGDDFNFHQVGYSLLSYGAGGGIFAQGCSNVSIVASTVAGNRSAQRGGGLAIEFCTNAMLLSSRLSGNTASGGHGESPGSGGALYLEASPWVSITGCTIESNACVGVSDTVMSLTIGAPGDSFYVNNHDRRITEGLGGGLHALTCDNLSLRNCEFTRNEAGGGGGIYLQNSQNCLLESLVLTSNLAFLTESIDNIQIVNQSTRENYRQVGYEPGLGGAIIARNSALSLRTTRITDNLGNPGAAIANSNSAIVLASSMLRDNSAASWQQVATWSDGIDELMTPTASNRYEAGVHVNDGSLILQQTTLMRTGGAFTNHASGVAINSIVWDGNWDSDGSSLLSAQYCNIQGGPAGVGNLTGDPELTVEGRLTASSPCRDSGAFFAGLTNDWEGELVVDGWPDIGADEFVDVDNDDLADAWELALATNLTSISGFTDDDQDGADGVTEYWFNSNPQLPSSSGGALPDGWLISIGLDPNQRQDWTDYDLDWASTLDEYIAGTDPFDAASILKASLMITGGSMLELTWPSAPNRLYDVDVMQVSLEWLPLATNLPGPNASFAIEEDWTNQALLRVKARLAPE
ncbi:MAG: hypothetical protein H7A43_03790 [Verrucomicrobia bacterium]|nr:hypothetical protein [Kiritimatiellia bacterium]MCP5487749.1 hypothetical protein [Verrucomicrobiota bacterium]